MSGLSSFILSLSILSDPGIWTIIQFKKKHSHSDPEVPSFYTKLVNTFSHYFWNIYSKKKCFIILKCTCLGLQVSEVQWKTLKIDVTFKNSLDLSGSALV